MAIQDQSYVLSVFTMALRRIGRRLLLCENVELKLSLCEERSWCHEINNDRRRYGEYHTLFPKLLMHDEKFSEYFRMSKYCFDIIHESIRDRLSKVKLNYRDPISTEERLVVTLR